MAGRYLPFLLGILYANCGGALGRLHPKVKKLHRPHHAMFSADPSPCPCMSNLQEQLSDEEVARLMRKDVVLPTGPIIKGVDKHGKTKYYPADYGNSCKAWDRVVDPVCKQKFPPAHCNQQWCFVNPDCAKKDTHRTSMFPSSERFVSFEACGSFDAQQAYECHTQFSESSCTQVSRGPKYPAGGRLCEWSAEVHPPLRKSKQVCQPERCSCTGQHMGEKVSGGLYGSQCNAWDRQKCEEWQEAPDAKMGIFCCQSWCYVDASCPSASPASTPGLYWSYAACADDLKTIRSCPWKEPIGWHGSPAMLSDGARHTLKNANTRARARTEKGPGPPPWERMEDQKVEEDQLPSLPLDSTFAKLTTGSGFFLLLICLFCCCCLCCKNNSSSDENASPGAPPAPPAPPGPAARRAEEERREAEAAAARKAEYERRAAEATAAARRAEERRAAGAAASSNAEAESTAAEAIAARKAEVERRAAEVSARIQEEERRAAEAAASRKAEEERRAAEAAATSKAEEERKAAEAIANRKAEIERRTAEVAARIVVEERRAADASKERNLKAEEERRAAEAAARQAEEELRSAEAAAAAAQPKAKAKVKGKPRPKPKAAPF